MLASFLVFLDVTIVNVAFPSISESFPEATLPLLSWVLNGYNVVFAALLVPAGRLADRLGRERMFMAGVALFTVASALCAAAPSPGALIAARALQAVGAAIVVPTAAALLLAEFPAERQMQALAAGSAAAGASAALGPSLGGALIDTFGWRAVFVVNLPLGLMMLAWCARWMRRRAVAAGPLPDALGTILLAASVGLVALALVQGNDWGWTSGAVIAAAAGVAVLGPAAVVRSLRHPSPAFDLSLLRLADFRAANTVTLLFGAGFYAKLLCDVLFLTIVWGYSVATAGLALSPSPLMTVVTAPFAQRLSDRFGTRAMIVAGTALYGLGSAWFALRLTADRSYVADFLPATVCTGAGAGLALPAVTSAAVRSLRDVDLGTGAATNAMARQIGGVLGIAALVAILGTGPALDLDRFQGGWLFTTAACGAAAAVALAIARGGIPQAGSPDHRLLGDPRCAGGGERSTVVRRARSPR